MYLRECPWLPAQDALRALNAYRTPRDKVKCVIHCAKCIMDLLSLSQNRGSTTADDFTPVLVYVIIKVSYSFIDNYYLGITLASEKVSVNGMNKSNCVGSNDCKVSVHSSDEVKSFVLFSCQCPRMPEYRGVLLADLA